MLEYPATSGYGTLIYEGGNIARYQHLTIITDNERFRVYERPYGFRRRGYVYYFLPVLVLACLSFLPFKLSIIEPTRKIMTYSISNECRVSEFEPVDKYFYDLTLQYLDDEGMWQTQMITSLDVGENRELLKHMSTFYNYNYETNSTISCYYKGDFATSAEYVNFKIEFTTRIGIIVNFSLLGFWIFIFALTITWNWYWFTIKAKTNEKVSKDIFENPETHKIVVEDWGEVPQNERLRQCLHSFLFSICSKKGVPIDEQERQVVRFSNFNNKRCKVILDIIGTWIITALATIAIHAGLIASFYNSEINIVIYYWVFGTTLYFVPEFFLFILWTCIRGTMNFDVSIEIHSISHSVIRLNRVIFSPGDFGSICTGRIERKVEPLELK